MLCPESTRVPAACRCETKKKVVLCPQPWTGATCAADGKAGASFSFKAEPIGGACTGFRRGLPGKVPGNVVACSSCPQGGVGSGQQGGACEGFVDAADGGAGMARGSFDCASR